MHLKETEISAETITSKVIFGIVSLCLSCVAFACVLAIIVCIQEAIEYWLSITSSLYVLAVPFLILVASTSLWMVAMMVIEIISHGKKWTK